VSRFLPQFLQLEAEAETHLGHDDDARTLCAIIRGRLELAHDHAVPFDLDDLERDFARLVAQLTGDGAWRNSFLVRLRFLAQRMRLAATTL
jgi:hypothetical protein